MAAIGINVSDGQQAHGWEAIMPTEISALEKDYRHAKRNYDDACARHIQACDYLEDVKERGFNQALVDMAFMAVVEAERRMDEAEIEKSQAYNRLSCPHTHVKVDSDMPDGMTVNVCLMCGAFV